MIDLSNDDIDRLREIVAGQLGLVFDHSHWDDLARVLRQRIRETGAGNASTYLGRLNSATPRTAEIRELANALTVAETYFFRHPDQLRAFSEVAVPQRLAESDQPLRILSAGCALGEEPYSLAILVKEALAGREDRQVRITGIDVSPSLLARAAQGRYSEWSVRATPLAQRQRYFHCTGREFLLDSGIRDMVSFQERNLLEDDPGFWAAEQFDIIFFRNVTIYFARETAKAVIARMARSLCPGGFLFLGPSETLREISTEFHLRHSHDAFYYQRRRPGEEHKDEGGGMKDERIILHPSAFILPSMPAIQADPDESWVQVIHRAAERVASATGPAQSPGRPAAESEPGLAARSDLPAPSLRAAQALLHQERFDEAMAVLAALPAASAADPDALLLRAAILTNKGSITEAERACRRVLEVDELNAGAHYLLALCREHSGERHAAAEHDQTAIYLDPAFAMPHLHLGMMTRHCGDLTTARRELEQALALLERELTSRILLFGGGFSREALVQLCRSELRACGVAGVP